MMQSTLMFWGNFGYDVAFKGVKELWKNTNLTKENLQDSF
jgi:hypothetical protein